MNVVYDTGIVGQIKEAIATAESNGKAIKQIEVTEAEMKEFLNHPNFKIYIDKHYGAFDLPVPLHIEPCGPNEVPKSCWYMGAKIVNTRT